MTSFDMISFQRLFEIKVAILGYVSVGKTTVSNANALFRDKFAGESDDGRKIPGGVSGSSPCARND